MPATSFYQQSNCGFYFSTYRNRKVGKRHISDLRNRSKLSKATTNFRHHSDVVVSFKIGRKILVSFRREFDDAATSTSTVIFLRSFIEDLSKVSSNFFTDFRRRSDVKIRSKVCRSFQPIFDVNATSLLPIRPMQQRPSFIKI